MSGGNAVDEWARQVAEVRQELQGACTSLQSRLLSLELELGGRCCNGDGKLAYEGQAVFAASLDIKNTTSQIYEGDCMRSPLPPCIGRGPARVVADVPVVTLEDKDAYDENDLQASIVLEHEYGEESLGHQLDVLLHVPKVIQHMFNLKQNDTQGSLRLGRERTIHAPESGTPQISTVWKELYVSNEIQIDRGMTLEISNKFSNTSTSTFPDPSNLFNACNDGRCPLRPYGRFKLIWDFLGLTLVLYDAVMIPITQAFSMDQSQSVEIFVAISLYWLLDIIVNFSTGIIKGTVEVMAWRSVAAHYIRTWFSPDILMVSLDVTTFIVSGSFHFLRGVRVIRALRLLRLLKMSKLAENMEDVAANFGFQWVVLVFAVLKTMVAVLLVAHMLSCLWYMLGKSTSGQGQSWLDTIPQDSYTEMYTYCLYWNLGHLTAAPVDPNVEPRNQSERTFVIMTIALSLLVLGTATSKITNTMAELNRLNASAHDISMQLRRFLRVAGVSPNQSMRIQRFAIYAHQRHCSTSLDAKVRRLLSESILSEITETQRAPYLIRHPLFNLLRAADTAVFRNVCGAYTRRMYYDHEVVFKAGTWGDSFYVTDSGVFRLTSENSKDSFGRVLSDSNGNCTHKLDFSQSAYFCEASLFTRALHHSQFTALTFADSFILSCEDFARSVSHDPKCITLVYKYGQEYLGRLWEGDNMPQATIMLDDFLPLDLAAQACTAMLEECQSLDNTLCSPLPSAGDVEQFMTKMSSGSSDDYVEIAEELPQIFRELHPSLGIYAQMQHLDEQKRAISAMLCVWWLKNDNYDRFVESQKASNMMSRQLWRSWQEFVGWANLNDEMMHALMVLLAIRGIGKIKPLAKAVRTADRSPENIILRVITDMTAVVPSVSLLTDDMVKLVQMWLQTNMHFNLAQMLQGENTPSEVSELQSVVQGEEDGELLLKFYLFGLVGVMCGIHGAETQRGSKFMDEKNGHKVLQAIQCLRSIGKAKPHEIYWGFIASVARSIDLELDGPNSCALARLACLVRVETEHDLGRLHDAWNELSLSERTALTRHFLADGISEVAVVFKYLPLYFQNAIRNKFVGLTRALSILLEIIQMVEANGYDKIIVGKTVPVDISDVASFTSAVQSVRVFMVLAVQVRFHCTGFEIQARVSNKQWQRAKKTSDEFCQTVVLEDSVHEMTAMMKKLGQTLGCVESMMELVQAKDRRRNSGMIASRRSLRATIESLNLVA